MHRRSDRRQPAPRPIWLSALTLTLALGAVLLAGCGSNSSTSTHAASTTAAATTTAATSTAASKPPYCAAISTLEQSVKAIPNVSVIKNGTSSLKAAVAQVQTNATTVVNEAKTQFATQTSALKTSVDTLSTSVQQLASTPTAAQLKALPGQISAMSTATKSLVDSTSPTCG